MDLERIYKIFETFDKDKFSFVYRGEFSNPTLIETTDILHKDLSKKKMEKVKNKISFLMVEAFQNVARYAEKEQSTNELFILRNIHDIFYITTINLITDYQKNYIEENLREVNNLSPEELKRKYVEILTNKQFSEKGGAGLGFIEMLRKSKEKIQYHFTEAKPNYHFFYFQLKFKSNQKQKDYILPIEDAVDIHNFFEQQKILFFYKGDFSHSFISPMTNIVAQNTDIYTADSHRIIKVMAELIQNVSHHSPVINGEKKGMLTVSREQNKFYIYAGNFVTEEQKDKLKILLDELNSYSKEQLEELYNTWLLDIDKGLGLVTVILTSDCFGYDFLKSNDDKYFFLTKVEIAQRCTKGEPSR